MSSLVCIYCLAGALLDHSQELNHHLLMQGRYRVRWSLKNSSAALAFCTHMMRRLRRVILLLLRWLVKLISNPRHERKELTVLVSHSTCQGFFHAIGESMGTCFCIWHFFSFSVSCGGGVQIDGFELRRTAIQMGARRLMKSCPPETHSTNPPDAEKCLIFTR